MPHSRPEERDNLPYEKYVGDLTADDLSKDLHGNTFDDLGVPMLD